MKRKRRKLNLGQKVGCLFNSFNFCHEHQRWNKSVKHFNDLKTSEMASSSRKIQINNVNNLTRENVQGKVLNEIFFSRRVVSLTKVFQSIFNFSREETQYCKPECGILIIFYTVTVWRRKSEKNIYTKFSSTSTRKGFPSKIS